MLKLRGLSSLTAGIFLTMICLGAAPAEAHPVTYVSGKGSDANDCFSPATPCRSFQRAVNQTVAGGEVKALDPADYFPVTISKSISLTGVPGAGIDTNGGTAITIGAPPTSLTVNLTNLIIRNVSGSGANGIGIFFTGATVTHCTVQGYSFGIVSNEATLIVANSIVTNNQTGISAGKSGVELAHSTVTGNTVGINILFEGSVISFGDNHIYGNGTNVTGGTLTNVGTQ